MEKNNREENKLEQNQNNKERKRISINGFEAQISPITAAFIGLIGVFFLYQFVGGLFTLIIFGFDLNNAPVNGLRIMTMISQLFFILLPAILFSKWFYNDTKKILKLKIPNYKEIVLFLIGIFVLTPLLQNYVSIQNHFIEKMAEISPFINSIKSLLDSLNSLVEKSYKNLLSAKTIYDAVFVIFVVSIVPAVSEEIMFRGFIQGSFELKLRARWAIIITAVFFGFYHFNPYGLVPLIILGLYFSFAAYMSRSIVVPMILHFTNNFIAIIMYFIIGDKDLIDPSASGVLDIRMSFFLLILFAVIFIGIVYLIFGYYRKKKMEFI
ncbi:MAG TPA: CPBP family intramembrane metalloprotease [Ignavibacteria bacterium]|nr:CPBP family intramembrane metalloprotease [Ignavibacteria bacterium]